MLLGCYVVGYAWRQKRTDMSEIRGLSWKCKIKRLKALIIVEYQKGKITLRWGNLHPVSDLLLYFY